MQHYILTSLVAGNIVKLYYDICIIECLRKYFFASLVASYLLAIIGVPVYFHYCGGELEEISYMIESDSCCGDDDVTDPCCKDESSVLRSASDFTKDDEKPQVFKAPVLTVFHLSQQPVIQGSTGIFVSSYGNLAVPLSQAKLVSSSVLRI